MRGVFFWIAWLIYILLACVQFLETAAFNSRLILNDNWQLTNTKKKKTHKLSQSPDNNQFNVCSSKLYAYN